MNIILCLPVLIEINRQSNSPLPFWHQGLVSWKAVFPWTGGVGAVFQDDSSALHLLCILFLLLLCFDI